MEAAAACFIYGVLKTWNYVKITLSFSPYWELSREYVCLHLNNKLGFTDLILFKKKKRVEHTFTWSWRNLMYSMASWRTEAVSVWKKEKGKVHINPKAKIKSKRKLSIILFRVYQKEEKSKNSPFRKVKPIAGAQWFGPLASLSEPDHKKIA